MLKLTGKGTAHTGDGITRRDFLEAGSLSAIGLSLAEMTKLQAEGAIAKGHDERSVIMIFNLGAPSQMDTFDMKPEAPAEIRGPFKPILTTAPGVEISEIFPLHAQQASKFSIVRSCYHTAAAVHDTGHQMVQTGRLFTGGINSPHAGCVSTYLRGRRSDLPAHVILPEPMGRTGGGMPHGQDAGFLGKAYDPFVLMADPSTPNFKVPNLLPPKQIGEARISRRRRLRDIVETTVKGFEESEDAKLLDSSFQAAFRIVTSKQARQAFDLSKESKPIRESYGMTRFGQSCLLARRLIEAGWPELLKTDPADIWGPARKQHRLDDAQWSFLLGHFTLNDYCGVLLFPDLTHPDNAELWYTQVGRPIAEAHFPNQGRIQFIPKPAAWRSQVDPERGRALRLQR